MSDRVDLYAQAFLAVIAAEGQGGEVTDELFRFSRLVEGNDELRETLADANIPAARRQQIVEDLLSGKASDTTTSLVSLVVGAGRSGDLTDIVDRVLDTSARSANRSIAEVRSAVDLTEDQRTRLVQALKAATGEDVELVVTVDPAVMGGLVVQIGDTVIDDTVRSRLAQLRESF